MPLRSSHEEALQRNARGPARASYRCGRGRGRVDARAARHRRDASGIGRQVRYPVAPAACADVRATRGSRGTASLSGTRRRSIPEARSTCRRRPHRHGAPSHWRVLPLADTRARLRRVSQGPLHRPHGRGASSGAARRKEWLCQTRNAFLRPEAFFRSARGACRRMRIRCHWSHHAPARDGAPGPAAAQACACRYVLRP